MQGSNSIATVKRFLKNYKMFLHNVDTLTYIREDIQVTKTTQDDKISFSHGLINIKHQGKISD